MGQGGSGDPGDGDDVDVEHAVPFVVVVGIDLALGADAGVVDDDVDAAVLLRGRLDGRIDGGPIGDVAAQTERLLGCVGRVEVEDGDVRASFEEELGDGAADARGSSRDDGGEAGELCIHDVGFRVEGIGGSGLVS